MMWFVSNCCNIVIKNMLISMVNNICEINFILLPFLIFIVLALIPYLPFSDGI